MTTKPEALRLADELETPNVPIRCAVIAAELRRLHEQNEKFKWQVRDTCARAEKAEAENERLRDILTDLYDEQNGPPLVTRARRWNEAMERARAALAKETKDGS